MRKYMRKTRRMRKSRHRTRLYGGTPNGQIISQEGNLMNQLRKTAAYESLTPHLERNKNILINVTKPKTIRSENNLTRKRSNAQSL